MIYEKRYRGLQQTETSMTSSYDEAFSIDETTAAGKEKPNKLEATDTAKKDEQWKVWKDFLPTDGGSDGVLDDESKSKACRRGVKTVQEI